jgi:hypothetical protein
MKTERRAELERFRWYNPSLDEALEELGRAEAKIAKALTLLSRRHHYVGVEGDLFAELQDILTTETP